MQNVNYFIIKVNVFVDVKDLSHQQVVKIPFALSGILFFLLGA